MAITDPTIQTQTSFGQVTIATIQAKTGNEADLVGFESGEFGLAEDTSRLFIGGLAQGIVSDGSSKSFPIDLSKIRYGNKVYVTVNSYPVSFTQKWDSFGGTVTLGATPVSGDYVEIRSNSEIQLKGSGITDMQAVSLDGGISTPKSTGIKFVSDRIDTGVIEFSISGNGFKQVGTFYFITDLVTIEYAANSLGLAPSKIELIATINGNIIELQYTNSDSATATLYFNSKTWKTV